VNVLGERNDAEDGIDVYDCATQCSPSTTRRMTARPSCSFALTALARLGSPNHPITQFLIDFVYIVRAV